MRPPEMKPPSSKDVEVFLTSLEHPLKPELLAVGEIILSACPSIIEGIKWNAPSFRTSEWFATFHLRGKTGLRVILHLGAKVRGGPDIAFDDPLLVWLGKDRASVSFQDAGDVAAKRDAFAELIRRWIKLV
ncbi:protein of unknown function (DU1801) [Singulisphaera sp. GP187]|uniref:DUF1801 domain-containing protein n=1 Tax=Singulisphaera sp. GP187 TaxID=1882752 RepID=UPI00092A3492|nr:DUF1801 domain-containing protein [Singulisphaera sp. GP187]SIN85866.1 protein of unknown function (DU1801) [Singulisphaera sp. GP187]